MDGMHPSDKPNSSSPSPSPSSASLQKQPEECRHNSDLLQPTAHTSEPIAAATIAGSSSSSASGTATPSSSSTSAHSLRKQASGNSLRPSSVLSLSLQGNGGNSTLKRCPLSPELMPAASAEAVMADLKSNQDVADDRKSSHSTTTRNGSATSSASKALEKIIQLSGPTTTAALTAPTSSSTPPPPKDNEPQPSSAENTPTTDHTSDQLATPAAAAPTPPLPVPHAAAAAATTLLGTEDHHTFSASSPPSTPRSSTPAPTDKSHSPEPAAASRSRTAVQLYKQENASQRSSLSILADWWSGNNASSTTTTTTTTTTTAAIAVSEPTTQNNHPSQPSVTQEQPTLPSLDHSQDTPLQTGQQQQQKKDPKDTLPRDDVSTTDGHTSSASKPTAAVHNDLSETTRRSMENWEPSGPEKTALERFKASEGRDPACSSSTSLPSSLPSHLTSPFPVSMIKSSGAKTKAESAKEQRSSTGSSSSSSSWWGLWNANGGVGDHGNQGVVTDMGADDDNSPSRQVSTITTSHLSSLATEVATASELHMELLEGEEAVRSSQSSLQMSSETLGRTEGGLTMAATSASERSKQTSKRWTIFGLGGGSSSSSNGSVSGDEAKGNGSTSKEETTAPDSSAVLTSDHATTGTTILKTSVAVPNVDAGAVATTTTKGGEEDSQKGGVAVPTAPALVGTAEVDVTVQTGGGDVTTKDSNNNKTKKQKESPTLAPANSSYSGWLSVIPGFGNRSAEDAQAQQRRAALQEAALSHQITDYEEGERHDIHGNLIKFEPQTDEDEDTSVSGSNNDKKKATAKTKTFAQLAEEKHDAKAGKTEDSSSVSSGRSNNNRSSSSSPPPPSAGNGRQTLAQLKETKETTLPGKAAAALSKMIKPKNVVLPAYYEQFPDALECMLCMPAGPSEMAAHPGGKTAAAGHTCQQSIMSSAVNVLSSILFPRVTRAEQDAKAKARAEAKALQQSKTSSRRGPGSVHKVVIFGIHGWFPTKLVRTVIGEPTGTSQKFCDEMDLALKDYLKANKVQLAEEDITLIPLEGEGKVLDRVELLYDNLMKNNAWRKALHEADLVLVATHSQGTPTSFLLLERLIEEGHVRVKEDDPRMQQVGMLAMAGISHGPFPFLKGNLIVRWVEAEAAGELFEFMDSETEIAKRYWQAIRTVLMSGVRLTCVASLEDQVVPMYSAVMTSISHPSIVRAVYIDGVSYQDDFLTNLISFTLRLRNAGIDDHGVLVHLSEVVAGSIYGEGHSTIYDEREVYMLALRALLEPSSRLTPDKARSEPIMTPFKAKQRLNPFYLPWGMRGIVEDIARLGDEELSKGLEHLKQLYEKWVPATKGLKEIKFRLEPVRSRL